MTAATSARDEHRRYVIRTATRGGDRAIDRVASMASGAARDRVFVALSRSTERPFGPRFGALVHATLATVPLDASEPPSPRWPPRRDGFFRSRQAAVRRRGSLRGRRSRHGRVARPPVRSRAHRRTSRPAASASCPSCGSPRTASSSKARSTSHSRTPGVDSRRLQDRSRAVNRSRALRTPAQDVLHGARHGAREAGGRDLDADLELTRVTRSAAL